MQIYLLTLATAAFLLVAHVSGIWSGLYLAVWPYDIFMHVLGGLSIGLFVAAAARDFMPWILKHRKLFIALAVFAAGFIWELFEIHYNIAGYPFGTRLYFIDTIKDLIDDVIGGFIALYIDHLLNKSTVDL
jgi:hypothetical protein